MTQTATTSQPASGRPDRRSPGSRRGNLWDSMGMLLVLAALCIAASIFVPNFLNRFNRVALALSVSTVGIIACTMLFCLASGDFDLSVGSVVAFAGVLSVMTINATGNVPLGIAAGIMAGAVVGLVNGLVIAYVGINALITTLATMQMVRGLTYIVCDGKSIGVTSQSFSNLGNWTFQDMPLSVWIMLACFVVFGLLLNRTTFGRNTMAIGGNKEAAHLAGISVARTKMTIFAMQGMVAALAGVVLSARMTSGQPMVAQGLELQVISGCVLGGVSLSGGVGSMIGVIVGVLIMGVVQNVMNLMNIQPFYQYLVSGAILLAAVTFDRLKQLHRR